MEQVNKNSFENWIIQCCKAKEWDLRKFLKKKLTEAGFIIQEDNYLSRRCEKVGKYSRVHNLLAIRGNPRICLVAHTDVCRDHSWTGDPKPPDVNPVIKTINENSQAKKIIQDAKCEYQTGGDDRLGVAINSWLALNTGYDLALLFTTDEEIGLVSAGQVRFPELWHMDLLVQVDRGNQSNQLVTRIGATQLCSERTAKRLLKISEDMNAPRKEVNGLCTDVQAIIRNGVGREAVNMTCGYHNSFGDSEREYIDIEEARSTMSFVSNIIKYYDLEMDAEEEKVVEAIEEAENDDSEILIPIRDNIIYIEESVELLSRSKEKKYKKTRRGNKKRNYIEAIFDES